jgi:hypothetical protein
MSDVMGAKAISLVQRGGITEAQGRIFRAQGQGDTYTVTFTGAKALCTCEAGKHDRPCYHVRAARLFMAEER